MIKGTIYLEPRATFDAALLNTKHVWYSFDLLIDVLMNTNDWDYFEAIEWYCYNIEPLQYNGLVVVEDDQQ